MVKMSVNKDENPYVELYDDAENNKRLHCWQKYWNKNHTVVLAFTTFIIYVLFGALYYHFSQDNWTYIDGLYFSIVTLSTCGYGDMTPQGSFSIIFTTIYILIGLGLIAGAISVLASAFLESQFEKSHELTKSIELSDDDHKSINKCTLSDTTLTGIQSLLRILFVILIGIIFYAGFEDMSIIDAYWFSCITIFTVGYDAPEFNQFSKLFTCHLYFIWMDYYWY